MSRPKFWNTIMTPGIIRSIRADQERYDRDPEAYEAQERQRKEDYEREQQALREEYDRALEEGWYR